MWFCGAFSGVSGNFKIGKVERVATVFKNLRGCGKDKERKVIPCDG